MALALSLGRRGLGQTWPNPAVGCVIVTGDTVLGRGWTAPGGRPHAETRALAQAGEAARGATAYVSLEPCAHHGQTPPCSDALIAAGVARVVTALQDPDPRTAGKGHAALRAAGIAVEVGCLGEQAERDHAGFLRRTREGRPLISLKLASSIDGRIATASGESRWITGPAARRQVHAMRAAQDAVLVGSGTALADDPMLDIRDLGISRQPVRIVCDTRLRTPLESRLRRSARDIPVWLCHGPNAPEDRRAAWQKAGAVLLECRTTGGHLDLGDMAQRLGERGLTRVFCEGGGGLAAGLLAAGLVDRLAGFTAGLALGGTGFPSIGPLGQAALADYPRFRLTGTQVIGPDVLHLWDRVSPDAT
ncbi:MAG: bifunctional diaminohydroxyphosphoribosylaminopyrimidine deaminase/5-amino-6-(5-phosphoribosylamino)uracil reductase RibD [Rhodobacteraceae bacterium]|nr:bifunctional diaminohydroxyphosphoribosylaminopyrimidine deaminase/5-amino-6-(5-phosphoribosylamino)uracil reductase RibD [Paracoccaceae bacterium]